MTLSSYASCKETPSGMSFCGWRVGGDDDNDAGRAVRAAAVDCCVACTIRSARGEEALVVVAVVEGEVAREKAASHAAVSCDNDIGGRGSGGGGGGGAV